MFYDRYDAGIKLASLVVDRKRFDNAVVVSLPRGGVVVGDEVARALNLPHAVLVVKKIGAPQNPELAIGATGTDGVVYWDDEIVLTLGITDSDKQKLLDKTTKEIRLKEESLGLKIPEVRGKNVLIVDDGVATGATAIAASLILYKLGSRKNILVTPVISKQTKHEIEKYFDEIITAELPQYFRTVGEFYRDFPQIKDEEVRKILKNRD